jgi:hypothetical protein
LARRADVAVAACLLLVLGALGAPLLVATWWKSKQVACANNLRVFSVDLGAFADRTDDYFPPVEPDGPSSAAGAFVLTLREAGTLGEVSVGCPAREARRPPHCTLRDLGELYRTDPDRYQEVAAGLSGDYAYCLGYREGGSLRGLRRGCGDHLAILADRSGDTGGNSPNHGGGGQNVLFLGGNVRWCVRTTVGEGGDDIYLNRRNQVGAGLYRADTVLGSSAARP